MGNAKLQAKRTTTSLDINNPQTSDVVSTSKDEKKSISFFDAWTVCAFISTGVVNENAELVRHFLG